MTLWYVADNISNHPSREQALFVRIKSKICGGNGWGYRDVEDEVLDRYI